LETLQALVETGANADVPNNDDLTPLMFAADRNRLKFVKFLVSAGADPRAAAKDGRTALSIARERGHAFLERQLRERSRPR
ncbi:MAG: ankyrin repeat domain-containing protein, partial [Hyphomicrobiales bacterium]|nr:ankyrin repeat domain-containing protein [Hyphomicrobiales bacterium]